MEIPFTEAEKPGALLAIFASRLTIPHEQRFVLAEAIKTSNVPLQQLVDLLQYGRYQPDWSGALLPGGRSVRSCVNVYNELMGASPPATYAVQNPKRKFDVVDSSTEPTNQARQPISLSLSSARVLQPKPAPNGSPRLVSQSAPAVKPRKRGRPSKADIEARKAEEAIHDAPLLPGPGLGPGPQGEHPYAGAVSVESQAGPQVAIAPKSADSLHQPGPDIGAQDPTGEAAGKKKRGRPSSRKSMVSDSDEAVTPFGSSRDPPAAIGRAYTPVSPTQKPGSSPQVLHEHGTDDSSVSQQPKP
ncbi:hypothetical protein BP6252_02318 [Coleophoma cylindrospora]|uniref:Uncharacterized protein n=1 Tax=Coleophoma cylindrospora TaxID=1849047 RepID=A0A3D8SG43_9HELO|nr:hypothetical protein BP6252_02318 [Coleophoma cylindrospora]